MHRARWHRRLVVLSAVALTAATAATASTAGVASSIGPAAEAAAANHSYNVGVVYSRTGLLSAYGAQFVQGLRYGIKYATKGTGRVNGHKINLTLVDDAGDPSKAVAGTKDLIGKGYRIITGTASSGIALQLAPLAEQNRILYISGPAATDAITGINRYTFRAGRQSMQDVMTADAFLGSTGRKIVVFAQDTAFGAANVAAVNAILGGKGHRVEKILVPLSASDFTPFAQQAKNADADLLFVAWAGTTGPAMWRAMEQQRVVTAKTKLVTGLAERATYETYSGAVASISFLSHYVYTAPKNKVNDWLVREMRKRNQVPDLFTPDGFNAGIMIVRALKEGRYDTDRMIRALEGYKFVGPKGLITVRPGDHAMLQPMFHVKLTRKNNKWTPVVLKTLKPAQTAPPVKR